MNFYLFLFVYLWGGFLVVFCFSIKLTGSHNWCAIVGARQLGNNSEDPVLLVNISEKQQPYLYQYYFCMIFNAQTA